MEKKYQIITDTGANLTDELISQYDLRVLSLYFVAQGQEHATYADGHSVDYAPYYQMLRDRKTITTSSVSPGQTIDLCHPLLSQGYDILYIGMASSISGSFNTVASTLNILAEEFPERKIMTIDSMSAGLGQGLLVIEGAKLKAQGRSLEQVHAHLDAIRLKVANVFTLDSLYHLVKGGRVSKTAAVISQTVNLKPIMKADDNGKMISQGTVFGRKRALLRLVEIVSRTIANPQGQTIYISHGDCLAEANFLSERLRAKLPITDVVVNCLDLVSGSHAGPGAIAVFYLCDQR